MIIGLLLVAASLVVALTSRTYNGWWLFGIILAIIGIGLMLRAFARSTRPARNTTNTQDAEWRRIHNNTIYDQEENRR